MLGRYLTKREQQLVKRRRNAEELLAWNRRLDAEEREVAAIERQALAKYRTDDRHKTTTAATGKDDKTKETATAAAVKDKDKHSARSISKETGLCMGFEY